MANIDKWLNKKVMIVDDFPQMRQELKNILGSLGFTDIQERDDGKPAWEELQNAAKNGVPCDIVFTDINMLMMDGITLLKNLRNLEAYKKIPIFIVSTETEKNTIMSAIVSGATDYIIKPYDPQLVTQKLFLRLK